MHGAVMAAMHCGARVDRSKSGVFAGTAEIKANATDLFESGLRPAAIDNFRGKADLVGVDGNDYAYSFSWRLILPCDEPPGRPCEVTKFALAQR